MSSLPVTFKITEKQFDESPLLSDLNYDHVSEIDRKSDLYRAAMICTIIILPWIAAMSATLWVVYGNFPIEADLLFTIPLITTVGVIAPLLVGYVGDELLSSTEEIAKANSKRYLRDLRQDLANTLSQNVPVFQVANGVQTAPLADIIMSYLEGG